MSASNYPELLDSNTTTLPDNISDGSALDNPDHATLHNTLSDAVIALEAKLGTTSEIGNATLVSGSVTITDGAVNSTSTIFLTYTTSSAYMGTLYVYSQTNGSFIVKSNNSSDNNKFNWIVINQEYI